MKIKQTQSTTASLVEVELEVSQGIRIEPGAMVYKDVSIDLQGKTNGGLFKALSKSVLGGENFFTTEAIAKSAGTIAIAPKGFGNIKKIDTSKGQWFLADGAFLACDLDVSYESSFQNGISRGLLGGMGGFFILKTNGVGDLLVSGFGDLVEIELDGSKPFQIDNGHVVCWEETLNYKIEVASGMLGFKTGEGLLNTFTGAGKVIIQTRQVQNFAEMLIPFMPQQHQRR